MGENPDHHYMVDESSMIVEEDTVNDAIAAHEDDHGDSSSGDEGDTSGRWTNPPSYSEPWPSSYKAATDSLSITASPGNFVLLKQAQSFTQSITRSFTHNIINFSHHDLDIKHPLVVSHHEVPGVDIDECATAKCSVTQTVFNGFNVFVGIGLLSVPSTIREGASASLVLFLLYAGLCYFTSYLLMRCFETNKKITSFPALGQAAFGKIGRVFVSTIFYIELYFCCVEFIMLEADNLAKLFPNASLHWGAIYFSPVHFLGIIATLRVLPTCYIRDLRKISFISACGVVGAICIALSLFFVGITEDIVFHQTGPLVKWNGLPYTLGVYGFLPSTSLYLVVAVMGFLMFGEDTNAQITLILPAHAAASTVALFMTVISPLFKHSLLLNPLARSLEEFLPAERASSYWFIIPLRTTLVFSSVLIAFLVHFFGYVMAFAGSLTCLLASIVMPALCYVKVVKNLSRLETALCYVVAVIGLIMAMLGTYTSVCNIIQQY